MAKGKRKILSATANGCEFCEGIVYKLEVCKGVYIYQCKDCGNTYKKGSF